MLTISSCPKSFSGKINIIQRNAIRSWLALRPKPEILFIGDDECVQEVSREFEIRNMPDVKRNEYNTPLVNSIFDKAQRHASYDILCYINADIILTNDVMEVIQIVRNLKDEFLIIGRRWDIEINESLRFDDHVWEDEFKKRVSMLGSLHPPAGIDYFVFSKGLFSDVPPFALGRTIWDGWLVYYARSRGIPVIDATGIIWAIHQNHDYSFYPGGKYAIWYGEEAKQNWQLSKGHFCDIGNASHYLSTNGLHKRYLYLLAEPLVVSVKNLIKKLHFSRKFATKL